MICECYDQEFVPASRFGSNESSCIGHANKELALFFNSALSRTSWPLSDQSRLQQARDGEWAITLSQPRGAMTQSAKISSPVAQRRTDIEHERVINAVIIVMVIFEM
jgi:hypothetical protein